MCVAVRDVQSEKHENSAKVKKRAFLTHLQIALKFGIFIHVGGSWKDFSIN